MTRSTVDKQSDDGNNRHRSQVLKWCIPLCLGGILCSQLSFGSHTMTAVNENLGANLQTTTQSSRMEHHSNAHLCPKKDVDGISKSHSKSQSGEDKMLLQWFNGLCNGTYIEMGALDGRKYSNSYLFNKELGWSGVLIELSPEDYEKLKINRPKDMTINAAVCDERKKIHYLTNHGKNIRAGAVEGIYEFMPDSFRNQWWPDINLETPSDQIAEIDCIPMTDILEKSPQTYFDFYSLDVEGAEYEVLKSIDFNKYAFGILFVEADEHNPRKNLAIRTLLESKGYTYMMEHERSYWFVNQNFSNIYKDMLHN